MVEREFDVGEKTAKRDLSELVQRGLIEYLRHGRNGCYRLVRETHSTL
jgi:DeoR/GlpR family transcriptional regulator of sugar metabolism